MTQHRMTQHRTVPTKLLWIVLSSIVSASCTSDGSDTIALAAASDVLVDTEWIEAHADDPSVRLLEVGTRLLRTSGQRVATESR